MGQITSDKMKFTVVAIRRNIYNGFDNYEFTLLADWTYIFMWRDLDAIAIAWSDNFTIENHTCRAKYVTTGYVDDNCYSVNITPEAGIAY